MCGENSTGGSSAVRQIKGVKWGCRVTYCRMVGELSSIHYWAHRFVTIYECIDIDLTIA